MDIKDKDIRVNRDDLYNQVWEEPVSHLAPRYGISDVGLKKICRKLKVPTPPPGYWTRIRHGYKIKRKPLPKLHHGEPSSYMIRPVEKEKEPVLDQEASELVKKETQCSEKINVPKRLVNPHPLVLETRDILSKATPDEYGALHAWRKKYLKIRISRENLARALRIMNTLVKAFESRGFRLWNETDKLPNSYVQILGEKLEFSLSEKFRRIDHVPSEKEKKEKERYPALALYPRWDFLPTGKLTLSIEAWGTYGIRKRWSDSSSKKVERMLNDFIIGAIRLAGVKRQLRLEREEEKRKWLEVQKIREEEARKLEAEKQKLQDLENEAELWTKSKHLRAYIQAVEKAAAASQCNIEIQERLEKWLTWAKQHADQLDPLTKGLPFEKDSQVSGY